jgi:hypothetical protein
LIFHATMDAEVAVAELAVDANSDVIAEIVDIV